ncbi:MAG: hypothetical protein R3A10_22655 [Caldilineaceae bacterium]
MTNSRQECRASAPSWPTSSSRRTQVPSPNWRIWPAWACGDVQKTGEFVLLNGRQPAQQLAPFAV